MSLQTLVILGLTVVELFDSLSGWTHFVQYLLAFFNWPEGVCDVISGKVGEADCPRQVLVILAWTVLEKVHLEPSEAVFLLRPEVDNDVMSGVAIDYVGMDIHVKFSVSRSSGSRVTKKFPLAVNRSCFNLQVWFAVATLFLRNRRRPPFWTSVLEWVNSIMAIQTVMKIFGSIAKSPSLRAHPMLRPTRSLPLQTGEFELGTIVVIMAVMMAHGIVKFWGSEITSRHIS